MKNDEKGGQLDWKSMRKLMPSTKFLKTVKLYYTVTLYMIESESGTPYRSLAVNIQKYKPIKATYIMQYVQNFIKCLYST